MSFKDFKDPKGAIQIIRDTQGGMGVDNVLFVTVFGF